jgi:hypothetical protein
MLVFQHIKHVFKLCIELILINNGYLRQFFLDVTVDELLSGNLLSSMYDFQTDIDYLLSDCTSEEGRLWEVSFVLKKL